MVGITLNGEIKPPPSIDPCLPDTSGLIIFLSAEGGVPEILEEKRELSLKGLFDMFRGFRISPFKLFSGASLHRDFLSFLACRLR